MSAPRGAAQRRYGQFGTRSQLVNVPVVTLYESKARPPWWCGHNIMVVPHALDRRVSFEIGFRFVLWWSCMAPFCGAVIACRGARPLLKERKPRRTVRTSVCPATVKSCWLLPPFSSMNSTLCESTQVVDRRETVGASANSLLAGKITGNFCTRPAIRRVAARPSNNCIFLHSQYGPQN